MKFSIIITTRFRENFLRGLIKSLNDTIFDKSNVEIHINYDNDDEKIHNTRDMINKYSSLKLYFHRRDRSEWMHRDYINWCIFNFCKGEYLISVNDDCAFKTPSWDQHILARLKVYLADKPDGIVYGRTGDGHDDKPDGEELRYTSFPLISRKAVNVLGFMFNNEFKSWNADLAIAAVFNNINRNLDMRDICVIDHITDFNGRRPKDEIDENTEKLYYESSPPQWDSFVDRDTEVIRKGII